MSRPDFSRARNYLIVRVSGPTEVGPTHMAANRNCFPDSLSSFGWASLIEPPAEGSKRALEGRVGSEIVRFVGIAGEVEQVFLKSQGLVILAGDSSIDPRSEAITYRKRRGFGECVPARKGAPSR